MIKKPIIAIALLTLAGCASNPPPQTAGQQAVPAAVSSPKGKRCVERCTDDYSACVARGRASGADISDCEPIFRACVEDC